MPEDSPQRGEDEPDLEARLQRTEEELERLRLENAALEAGSSPAAAAGRTARTGRSVGAFSLIAIGLVVALLANIAVWANDVVFDTDEYLSVVAPLASDPEVTDGLATVAVDRLLAETDAQARAEDALKEVLPTDGQFLSGAIVAGIRQVAVRAVEEVLRSEQFDQIWVAANRVAHEQLVAVLLDENQAVLRQSGQDIQLDLSPVLDSAATQLDDLGAGQLLSGVKIPADALTFTIAQGDEVKRAQRVATLLDQLGTWLPLIALALIGGGVLLANQRRRVLINAMIGLAVAMLLTLVSLRIGRDVLLNEIEPGFPKAAATDIWDAAVAPLRTTTYWIIAIALLVAIAGWLAGPGEYALRVRSLARRGAGEGARLARQAASHRGAVGAALRPYKKGIRIGAILLALLVLILIPGTSVLDVTLAAVAVLVVLGALEVLAPGRGEGAATDERPSAGSRHDSPY